MLPKRSANKRISCLILALFFLLFTPSCTKEEQKATDSEAVLPYTDALGRELSVPKNPKRVAALIGSFADVWRLAGGTLCAAAEDAEEDFGIDMDRIVSLGGAHSPSAEALLASKPELVLASASTSSNVEMLEILEEAGICTVYFDVDSFEDYLSMLRFCTLLTGCEENYERYGVAIAEEIDGIKSNFLQKDRTEDERKILLLRISSGSVKAKSSEGTVLGEMLSSLGFINLADGNKLLTENLNLEYILQENPYHVLVVPMGDEEKAKDNFQTMMEETPAWSSLEAIRENRMHVLDKKLFNLKPNARWAEAYETLSKLLENK